MISKVNPASIVNDFMQAIRENRANDFPTQEGLQLVQAVEQSFQQVIKRSLIDMLAMNLGWVEKDVLLRYVLPKCTPRVCYFDLPDIDSFHALVYIALFVINDRDHYCLFRLNTQCWAIWRIECEDGLSEDKYPDVLQTFSACYFQEEFAQFILSQLHG